MRLGHALEEPDVRDGRGEVDVAHALAAHLLAGHLDAAALADDALVADALVLAAVALPVLGGTEDALAEEAVLLGLERAVVDGLGLGHLTVRPAVDLLRGGETDLDVVEVVDVDQRSVLLSWVEGVGRLEPHAHSSTGTSSVSSKPPKSRSRRRRPRAGPAQAPPRRRRRSPRRRRRSRPRRRRHRRTSRLERVVRAQLLVGRERQLAVGVDAVLALLELLDLRLPRRGADAIGREVDAQLLRGAEQLVVLLGGLDARGRPRASASRRARGTASP